MLKFTIILACIIISYIVSRNICCCTQPLTTNNARQVPDHWQRIPESVPPSTDKGKISNLKYSFTYSHIRIEEGGWTREVTVRDLPISTTLAGVNMRLKPGGIRELHWHKEAEWAYMLDGKARITAVDQKGHNFIDDVTVGDLWYFPAGIPHSIQGLEEGCEFLLIFDDGSFSEDSTFLLTDWIAHTPPHIIEKNFNLSYNAFNNTPKNELYIFQGDITGPIDSYKAENPIGTVPNSFSYRLTKQTPIKTSKGKAYIADSHNFFSSITVAAALAEIEPGGLRELHWHPNADEWLFIIKGQARMTIFAAENKARTFNFLPYDIAYIPKAMGHYIENIGNVTLSFLEVFRSDYFADISLNQWLALTPPELVKSHLKVNDVTLQSFNKNKVPIV